MLTRYDRRIFVAITLISLVVLLALQYFIQVSANETQAMTTAKVLTGQIEKILDNNKLAENHIKDSLKEDYLHRAEAVSVVLKYHPEGARSTNYMKYLAGVMGVDEIHIFDENGTIVGGSHPQYYGVTFDDGQQIGYFKPMLRNKNLSLCQDVTPNTAEGESMMYAAVWNTMGDHIVQVGVKPEKLINYLFNIEIQEVVKEMPVYEGVHIVIANAETDKILGSSIDGLEGATLSDFDIHVSQYVNDDDFRQEIVGDASMYCYMDDYSDYRILILQDYDAVQDNVDNILRVIFIYLAISALIINQILKRMYHVKENSMKDPMTGMFNRRGFEMTRQEFSSKDLHDEMVALTADVNGLKEVNDVLGHDAGDRLIKGAAECLEGSLGVYGKLFRTGGDEFAGVLWMSSQEQETALENLANLKSKWNGENDGIELSIALGFARHDEYPGESIGDLFSYADQAMYDDKRAYYERTGKDRRKRRPEKR